MSIVSDNFIRNHLKTSLKYPLKTVYNIYMFKIIFWGIILSLNFTSIAQENPLFQGNEQLNYRIHLGFIEAATASVKTNAGINTINNHTCRKVEITGKTVSWLKYFSPVEDYWSAYLDINTLMPIKTEMRKREGRYKKQEQVFFSQELGQAKIHSTQNTPVDKLISISPATLDLIGGYFYLRNKELSTMHVGEKLSAKVLVDGTIYEIWFIVKGNETLKSDFGDIKCIRTSLVLPKNALFKDEDAIRLWISRDKYQIPFKMEVNLKIGFLSIDLTDYKIQGKKIY
jgi:hypothetical protein